MEKCIPRIRESFTNINNTKFNNVREIAYKNGELLHNLGKLVAETEYEPNDFFNSPNTLTGVYIYQTYFDSKKAYRIYREFADYNFNGYGDDILIQGLYERNNIKSAEFPTGVVTLEGRIIGQEIPYFENSITLFSYSKNPRKNINPVDLYKKSLKKLAECYANDIIYLDVHPKNFMLNIIDNVINVIDFESGYIKFADYNGIYLKQMLIYYAKMVNYLSSKFGISDLIGNFSDVNNFEDGLEQLDGMAKKLVLKKYI